ncbi:MAG: hypothetical protein BM556_15315 [Bacteriovorax sp. MedPE-SWde]|nr:MAG: hypothetical protein BM556_15315 [Bacteriovorax sp. MedPE-SWde]
MNLQNILNNELEILLTTTDNLSIDNKHIYANLVAQVFYYAKYSTKLLALAGVRTKDSRLTNRFFSHVKEETNHELLALRDLEGLGFSIDDFPELESTKAMYQTQYFQIEEYGAEALMGWILALEGYAIRSCTGLYQRANEIYGAKCTRFVRVHAEEDPDHFEKAVEQVSLIQNKDNLITNMKDSIKRYNQILIDCEKSGASIKNKIAA